MVVEQVNSQIKDSRGGDLDFSRLAAAGTAPSGFMLVEDLDFLCMIQILAWVDRFGVTTMIECKNELQMGGVVNDRLKTVRQLCGPY